jgi:hypothetical protein
VTGVQRVLFRSPFFKKREMLTSASGALVKEPNMVNWS